MTPKQYPHMCRDGHVEIGHADSENERCPLCRVLDAANEMEQALADIIEHVNNCDERMLLKCDIDPHPPSVFRCYADLAQAKLDSFRALKLGGER